MAKLKLATLWLDGCSGCHMSLLDIDERLIELANHVDIVYSPLVDVKEFPADVDITLIEGAVSTDDDLEKLQHVRSRTRLLIALGDCAVTANVPGMRNLHEVQDLLERSYRDNTDRPTRIPDQGVPALLPKSRPIHEIVRVDVHVPGCPPPADAIFYVLTELLEGRTPEPTTMTRFGK
ncbi:NADP oxidoreductase [bacterium]|nr:NADP oxidoreductase [bacterium]MBU1984528.1 NADP oxidoreductase [bacterium]